MRRGRRSLRSFDASSCDEGRRRRVMLVVVVRGRWGRRRCVVPPSSWVGCAGRWCVQGNEWACAVGCRLGWVGLASGRGGGGLREGARLPRRGGARATARCARRLCAAAASLFSFFLFARGAFFFSWGFVWVCSQSATALSVGRGLSPSDCVQYRCIYSIDSVHPGVRASLSGCSPGGVVYDFSFGAGNIVCCLSPAGVIIYFWFGLSASVAAPSGPRTSARRGTADLK